MSTTSQIVGRLSFGPSADAAQRWAGAASVDVVNALLSEPPLVVEIPNVGDDDDYLVATNWWLDVMRRPDAGFHERMVWFWHGHLTSSLDKSDSPAMLDQHGLLREHALGNFRTLLQAITVDAAMLGWLDGNGSSAEAPNENFGRELMELFALGRDSGAYTERDVRAGAKAFAGYWINDDGQVVFDEEAGLRGSVEFLGRRVRSAAEAVDAVCDHPQCAPFVVSALHRSFLGRPPEPDRLDSLANEFRDGGLEIAPLMTSMLTHESFTNDLSPRPRTPVEWLLALERLTGTTLDSWNLELLGQMPMQPPNVAGWPGTERWVSTGAVLTKAQIAIDSSWDAPTLDGQDPVANVLRRAALDDVSDQTRAALEKIAATDLGRRDLSSLLHAAVAVAPEFSLT
jgi:uncharacterized protein (DUF1800 family)